MVCGLFLYFAQAATGESLLIFLLRFRKLPQPPPPSPRHPPFQDSRLRSILSASWKLFHKGVQFFFLSEKIQSVFHFCFVFLSMSIKCRHKEPRLEQCSCWTPVELTLSSMYSLTNGGVGGCHPSLGKGSGALCDITKGGFPEWCTSASTS